MDESRSPSRHPALGVIEATSPSSQVLRLLAPAVFLVAALPFLGQVAGLRWTMLAPLRADLPIGVGAPETLTALISVGCLVGLAAGLLRSKRLAWWLALYALGFGVFADLLVRNHQVAVAVGVAAITALLVTRDRFGVASHRGAGRRVVVLLVLGALAAMLDVLAVLAGLAPQPDREIGTLLLSAATWGALGDAGRLASHHAAGLGLLLAIAARLPIALAVREMLGPAEDRDAEPSEAAHAVETIRRQGTGALLPFQLGPEARRFAVQGLDAAIAYGRVGRSVVVLGDPVGRDADRWELFERFLERCAASDHVPMIYQASGDVRARLLEAGFSCFRVGHEAIVPLAGFSLAGSRRANLRHTVTRARRGGITVRWLPDGLADGEEPELRAGLADVDAEWRDGRGPELGFTISTFDPDRLSGRAMAVALSADGSVAAFATFAATGGDGSWVLDLVRRSASAVPGAMEACLVEAAERLRDAGASRLSLGLAPLAGLDTASSLATAQAAAGPIEERLLGRLVHLVKPAYDVDGLAFFKSKFDPVWLPRYGAVRRARDLPGYALALLELHLGGSLRQLLVAGIAAGPALLAAAGSRGMRRVRAH